MAPRLQSVDTLLAEAAVGSSTEEGRERRESMRAPRRRALFWSPRHIISNPHSSLCTHTGFGRNSGTSLPLGDSHGHAHSPHLLSKTNCHRNRTGSFPTLKFKGVLS